MSSRVRICNVFPDLLGTYGDGGNVTVLAKRLEWRGIDHEVVEVTTGETVPSTCDVYLLGGGEDQPQTSVADQLIKTQALNKAVDAGAAVFAVCAGMQIIGETFAVGGADKGGIGLLDMKTIRNDDPRCVGELAVQPDPSIANVTLSGYENHGSVTLLGDGAKPLGKVVRGHGNGAGTMVDGAFAGKVIGTYMHGPALARNAALADRLLSWVVGSELQPLDDAEAEGLRNERLTGGEGVSETRQLSRRLLRSALRRVR